MRPHPGGAELGELLAAARRQRFGAIHRALQHRREDRAVARAVLAPEPLPRVARRDLLVGVGEEHRAPDAADLLDRQRPVLRVLHVGAADRVQVGERRELRVVGAPVLRHLLAARELSYRGRRGELAAAAGAEERERRPGRLRATGGEPRTARQRPRAAGAGPAVVHAADRAHAVLADRRRVGARAQPLRQRREALGLLGAHVLQVEVAEHLEERAAHRIAVEGLVRQRAGERAAPRVPRELHEAGVRDLVRGAPERVAQPDHVVGPHRDSGVDAAVPALEAAPPLDGGVDIDGAPVRAAAEGGVIGRSHHPPHRSRGASPDGIRGAPHPAAAATGAGRRYAGSSPGRGGGSG